MATCSLISVLNQLKIEEFLRSGRERGRKREREREKRRERERGREGRKGKNFCFNLKKIFKL